MRINLPPKICFRITRNCNANCRFCLAPPEGTQPNVETLIHYLDWLLSHGVKTIHFCGGEPTIIPFLSDLIKYVHAQGGKTKITTNAIHITDSVLKIFHDKDTQVKVSLHGDRTLHNYIVGLRTFDHTVRNLHRLIASDVRTSVQTTVVAEKTRIVDWMIDFCLEIGVRRLSIIPFIPRGRGNSCRAIYEMSSHQRHALRDRIKNKRRALHRRLDLRWLDFTNRPVPVIEPNGVILLEGATEKMDKVLCRIPEIDVRST